MAREAVACPHCDQLTFPPPGFVGPARVACETCCGLPLRVRGISVCPYCSKRVHWTRKPRRKAR